MHVATCLRLPLWHLGIGDLRAGGVAVAPASFSLCEWCKNRTLDPTVIFRINCLEGEVGLVLIFAPPHLTGALERSFRSLKRRLTAETGGCGSCDGVLAFDCRTTDRIIGTPCSVREHRRVVLAVRTSTSRHSYGWLRRGWGYYCCRTARVNAVE